MPQESDTAELRALQVKAYGRGGGLSDADADRLAALESARAPEWVEQGSGGPAEPEHASAGAIDADESSDAASGPASGLDPASGPAFDPASDPASDAADESPRDVESGIIRALRGRWKVLTATSAALVLVGLGVGWAVFGHHGDGLSLTAAQQERRTELQDKGGYDPGSLRAIGQEDDALVWIATKEDGDMTCLTLDIADESSTQCSSTDDLSNGLGGFGVALDAPRGDDEESVEQVYATAVRTTSGELVAVIQRWESSGGDWLSQFEGAERDRAEQLADEGFDEYSYSIVGYYGEAPVWYGQRTTDGLTEDCLVVDALEATQCAPAGSSQQAGIGVQVTRFDEGAGMTTTASVELSFTSSGTPYLVVSGDAPQS